MIYKTCKECKEIAEARATEKLIEKVNEIDGKIIAKGTTKKIAEARALSQLLVKVDCEYCTGWFDCNICGRKL